MLRWCSNKRASGAGGVPCLKPGKGRRRGCSLGLLEQRVAKVDVASLLVFLLYSAT